MNLPDAPIPNEGFLITHFLTVRNPDGYIIEVGQLSPKMIGLFQSYTT